MASTFILQTTFLHNSLLPTSDVQVNTSYNCEWLIFVAMMTHLLPGDMVDEIQLECNKLTSAAQICALRSSLQEFVTRDTEIADYRSADIIVDGVLDGYRLRINIQMYCRGNFQDHTRKNRRKVRLYLFLQDQIRSIGIDCRPMTVVDASPFQDLENMENPVPIFSEAQRIAQSVRS